MGVSHSMDREQVDEVLQEFEATTSSISGIETKMQKVREYMEAVQSQRRSLSHHAEMTTSLVDGLAESLSDQSKAWYDYFASSFEHLAGLVEVLETSLYNLKLEDAPRQIQREFGPLLVPAVVLVLIITASNCYFGFLLASDESLAFRLGEAIRGSSNSSENEAPGLIETMHNQMNILFLFAVAHVSLIGLAMIYILVDLLRRWQKARLRRSSKSSTGFWREGEYSDSGSEGESELETELEIGAEELRVEEEVPEEPQRGSIRLDRASRLTRGDSRASTRSTRSTLRTSVLHRTPVSSLMRRMQSAALRESRASSNSEAKLKDIFGIAGLQHKPTKDWLGKCRIKESGVVVRVAAASTSTVIVPLPFGKKIEVQQAIRGGKGKIWGRLVKPPGWILLADHEAGYRAVTKVKESPATSPAAEPDASRS